MLSFKNIKKKCMPVEFVDGTMVSVYLPTKAIFDNMIAMDTEKMQNTDVSEFYQIVAELISRNAENKKITAEYLEKTLDFEDLKLLYTAYSEFVLEVMNSPN